MKLEKLIEKRVRESSKNIPIIGKDWGKEFWIVNKEYCGKILVVNQQYWCSYHFHIKKDETFLVIKGKVLMRAGGKEWVMEPYHSQHIWQRCYHTFIGLEKNNLIVEFSTHHEDSDSYRVRNSGRVPDNEWEKIQEKYGKNSR